MIDELTFCRQIERALARCAARLPGDDGVANALRATRSRLADLTPLVFYECNPGYWMVGLLGQERPVPDPRLFGMEHVFEILLNGLITGDILAAEDFGCRSGKALGERLKTVSNWALETVRCTELSKVIESIVVGRDGRISYTPGQRQIILSADLHRAFTTSRTP